MARLTPTQWLSVRAHWESSPSPGLAWLTTAAGGAWPVTSEAIRRRRLAERWRKHSAVHSGEGTDGGCWSTRPEACGRSTPVFALPEGPAEALDDLRDAVLAQQRRDWAAVRRLMDGAVRGGDHGAFRNAKALAETLKLVQAGEREVHGLDAALLDFGSMSDAELQQMIDGKWPRKPR